MKNYKKRIADSLLDLKLESFGATLIVGPKGCGKTTTAKEKAKSFIEFQDEDKREGYLQGIAEIKDTFSQFRYCFELKGFALKQRFLLQFSKSLFNYCKENSQNEWINHYANSKYSMNVLPKG